MPLASGTRLGPYEIVTPIGAGGMGEVYRARDTRLDRTVALKILPGHLGQDPAFRQRFEREAKAISALNHPHICVLHDVGRQDGIDFLVMEHLEGQTLSDRLKKGALPLDQVLRYGVEMAEALDGAHRQGIVHRDLKPGNVMLTKTGTKLLDFGLAKVRPAGPAGEHEPTLTEAGELLGTPRYMAPEQLEGKEPDARSDIFALGTVFYEMATGQRAFPAKSQAGVISAILSSDPAPISTLQPRTPPALERAIATCLAKDPDDRWQSAHDLAAELRWIAEAGRPAAGPVPPATDRRRERLAWAAVSVVTAFVAFALGSTAARRRDLPVKGLQARFEIRAPGTMLGSLAVSPDGEQIVFRASEEGRSQLYVRPLDALTATPIPGTEEAIGPFWSPDGRRLAFVAEGKLKKLDLAGGSPQVAYDNAGSFLGGTWSPDGTMILSLAGDLVRLPAGGGASESLGKRAEGETRRSWPRFLPDGRHYLYLSDDTRPERQGIYVSSLGSDYRKRILASDRHAAYASSGHLLFLKGDALVAQRFDATSLELSGEAFPLNVQPTINTVIVSGMVGSFSVAVYSVSSNGVIAWVPAGASASTSLTWFDRAGKELGTVGEPAVYSNPALSPDERRLAVDLRNPQGTRDIWIFDLVRGGRMRVTFDRAEDMGPTWHPDGTRIAFTSERLGNRSLYQKLVNGAGDDQLLLESKDGLSSAEHWSPDGKWLVFNWRRPALPDLFMLPISGGRDPIPFLATEFREDIRQFSPDGRYLAYRSDESGRHEVYVRDVTRAGTAGQGKWQVSTEGGAEPRWRGDGKELFYVSGAAATSGGPGPGTLDAVAVTTDGSSFVAGAPRPIFEVRLPGQLRNRYVVTRDGQRFLVNRGNPIRDVLSIQVLMNWLPAKR